ncbi:hypothetical protein A2U01_0098730 [Trifolium medium]|nr:hypothetical protein [Trifolium medium]
MRQHQKKNAENMITLRVAHHRLARCAKGRKLNCPAAMNCALRQKQSFMQKMHFVAV